MRLPSNAWMIIALPVNELESAPVSTLTLPLLVPPELDVYAMLVHGSLLTAPV